MPPDELEQIRRDVLDALDFWAARGLGREITNLTITVVTYKKPGDQVYSRGQRDPQRKVVGRNETVLTFY